MKAGLVGAGLLASLALTRLSASAGGTAVTFAGRELPWACPVRNVIGLPCPSCGMTRSVIFTLHGEWGRAAAMNPAGPLLVFGVLTLGALLLYVGFGPRRGAAGATDAWMRRLFVGASAYGCLTTAVLLAHWIKAL